MKPLDLINTDILDEGNARKYLSGDEYAEFLGFTEKERLDQLSALLDKPIANFTVINELYFRTRWAGLIEKVHGPAPIRLLEVASGDADMIPQAISRSNPGSVYLTANMNQLLNESMLRKTEGLDITLQLIDDDASAITLYVEPDSVDLIAFQHAVNDVLQAVLCAQHGIDTVYSDWMKILPDMICLVQEEVRNNSLEDSVKEAFLGLLRGMLLILKPEGLIAMNHYMFQLDLDWGYPADLFEHMLPIIRPWLKELDHCVEVTIDGFDPQWWIFLKKN